MGFLALENTNSGSHYLPTYLRFVVWVKWLYSIRISFCTAHTYKKQKFRNCPELMRKLQWTPGYFLWVFFGAVSVLHVEICITSECKMKVKYKSIWKCFLNAFIWWMIFNWEATYSWVYPWLFRKLRRYSPNSFCFMEISYVIFRTKTTSISIKTRTAQKSIKIRKNIDNTYF